MSHGLTPNLVAAAAFLFLLDPAGIFTFQTFDDNKDRKDVGLARVLHGTFDQHKDALTRLQRRGAGVFVMVNRGDGVVHAGNKTCRTKANVVAVRSLFVEQQGQVLAQPKSNRPRLAKEPAP